MLEEIAATLEDQLIATEDYMMKFNIPQGWSVDRYGDVVVRIDTDYHNIWFTIAVANAPVDFGVWETDSFEEAVYMAREAYAVSVSQTVQF